MTLNSVTTADVVAEPLVNTLLHVPCNNAIQLLAVGYFKYYKLDQTLIVSLRSVSKAELVTRKLKWYHYSEPPCSSAIYQTTSQL